MTKRWTLNLKRPRRRAPRVALATVTAVLSALTLLSGYGGMIDPDVTTVGSLAAMALPLVAIATSVAAVVMVAVDRLCALALALILALVAPALWRMAPLNISRATTSTDRADSFKLLTYNVANFRTYHGRYTDPVNLTLSYILKADADVACLEECEFLCELPDFHVFQPQVDSIRARYPYIIIDTDAGNSILSKTPVERVDLPDTDGRLRLAAYRLTANGRPLTIIELHLASLMLTAADRLCYREALHGRVESDGLSALVGKVGDAFKVRAVQARHTREVIDSLLTGDENLIVCGDFNDIPGCYAMRHIAGDDMADAFSQAGRGYSATYHVSRFYFRIDHVLYRGALRPVDIALEKIDTSDHYPLLAEFCWTGRGR